MLLAADSTSRSFFLADLGLYDFFGSTVVKPKILLFGVVAFEAFKPFLDLLDFPD